jgi:hypothetical protein
MKKLTALTSILVLLLAGIAFAQVDADPDGLGVYFDTNGIETCFTTVAPFESVTGYLLLTNPSDSFGISGWEANIDVLGAAVAPAWTLAAGLDVDMSAAGFQVGIGTDALALPVAPAVVLATWVGFIMAPTDIVSFVISNVAGSSSFPSNPGYASGSNAGVLIPLQVSSGYPYGAPAAQINACDVVANEDMSFSNVKNLFR